MKIPSTEMKIPSTEIKMPSTELKIPSIELKIPSTELKIPSTEFKIPSTELKYSISEGISDTIKICFNSCKSCFPQGDEINHNCIECKEGYIFLNEFISTTNCYHQCPFYYFFNELNQYLCTENELCPEHYIKLIPAYKKCIDDCKKDRIYKYEYNNICYEQCPNNTSANEDYICKENNTGERVLYNCSNNNPLLEVCSVVGMNNNTGIYKIIINQMLSEYSNRGDKIQVINGKDNVIYQITKNKNELDLLKNEEFPDNYTLSIIDLGECESILKDEYNLKENDSLIIIKQEKLSDKSYDKGVQFDVYEPYNMTKLNLSLSSSTSINMYVKLGLSSETETLKEELQKLGYNMFDINNRFYTDLCNPFKTSR